MELRESHQIQRDQIITCQPAEEIFSCKLEIGYTLLTLVSVVIELQRSKQKQPTSYCVKSATLRSIAFKADQGVRGRRLSVVLRQRRHRTEIYSTVYHWHRETATAVLSQS